IRPRFSSAGSTQVRVYPPPRSWTRTHQPPASIRISSGSGRFRPDVTFVAADSASVAIAVIMSEVGPRNVDTIGRPARSPTTRARTPPISEARDSSVCASPPSVEIKFRSIDSSIVTASFLSVVRVLNAMKTVLTGGGDKAPRQLHLTGVGRGRASLFSRSKPRLLLSRAITEDGRLICRIDPLQFGTISHGPPTTRHRHPPVPRGLRGRRPTGLEHRRVYGPPLVLHVDLAG